MNRLIYIASKYSDPDPEVRAKNVNRSMDVAHDLILKGWTPIAPLLSHFLHTHLRNEWDLELPEAYWYMYDLNLLSICDSIIVLDKSTGTLIETIEAIKEKKVLYYSLDEVPRHKEGEEEFQCLITMAQRLNAELL